ncbi:MAG: endonuclease/exonuclease/phosphatase family protein [Tepidiformaceae bacterium]
MKLTVATYNIRNITDRYRERKPLLGAAFAGLDADIVGLQEVVFSEPRQDDFLAQQLPGRNYRAFDVEARPKFGNAILCSVGEVQAHETLTLSERRAAHRILVVLPAQTTLWFVNTHLHDPPAQGAIREEQTRAILAWMDEAPAADATIVAGDFNCTPLGEAYGAMVGAGFRSAHLEANAHEPEVTWPSGIQADTMDTDGVPSCFDYLWLGGHIRSTAARVAANVHAPGDPTLYPSDHFAIVASVEVARGA